MGKNNLLFFLLLLFVLQTKAQERDSLTFSEVMFRPSAANSEFIELFNISHSDSLDLNGWGIKYSNSKTDYFDSLTVAKKLPPRCFAVVFENDYDFQNGIYKDLISNRALTLKIKDNSFGTSGMSNSTDRNLFLISPTGDTVEVYTYSANNRESYSDEKILLNKDNSQTNWGNSKTPNGTPGSANSISPKDYDVGITKLTTSPEIIFEGDSIQIKATLTNLGLKDATDFYFSLFETTDSVNLNPIFQKEISLPTAGDSITVSTTYLANQSNKYFFVGILNFSLDQNTANDTLFTSCVVHPKPNSKGDLVINELMYEPKEDEPEWLELFNTTAKRINLKGWRVKDERTKAVLTDSTFYLNPKSYVVIARDSLSKAFVGNFASLIVNLPTLNNAGDQIVLIDSLKRQIDSVDYSSEWGGSRGISLERVSAALQSNEPSNWGSSTGSYGGTPGRLNSLTPKKFDLAITAFVTKEKYNIFPLDFTAEVKIKNNGLENSDESNLKIFLDANKDLIPEENEALDSLLIPNIPRGDSTFRSIIIGNLPVGKNKLIALITSAGDEFLDNNLAYLTINTVRINVERSDIVINEIMYAPGNNEPEWVELFNKSRKGINLKNYFLGDNTSTVKVNENDLIMKPQSYTVISKDSSLFDYYSIGCPVIVSSFPNLNNSGDEVVLKDSLSRTIDSVKYSSNWGGKKDFSLERISAEGSSTDSANWGSCTSVLHGTPGIRNSISQKDFDVTIDSAWAVPFNPESGSNLTVKVRVKNKGKNQAIFKVNIFEDLNSDSAIDRQLFASGLISLSPKDTVTVSCNNIKIIRGTVSLIAVLDFNLDEDSTNNSYYFSVVPSFKAKSVIVNEIMFEPNRDEPEWIELYNNSPDTINLKDWSISDVLAAPTSTILTNADCNLFPHEYFIVAKDSSIFNYHKTIPSKILVLPFANLNNSKDGVVLKDGALETIDSVMYYGYWLKKEGCSLERIKFNESSVQSSNWGTSKDNEQSTPGRINSLKVNARDVTISQISTEPEFPLRNESFKVKVKLKNLGTKKISGIWLKVFSFENQSEKLLDTLLVSKIEARDSLIITGQKEIAIKDSLKIKVKADCQEDENPYNNSLSKTIYAGEKANSIKISELMVMPDSGKPQWAEFFNASKTTIDVRNWKVSDVSPDEKVGVILGDSTIIKPGEYFVVSRDSIPSAPNNTKQFIVKFGSLSSKEDGIVLSDFRGQTIDSLFYNSDFPLLRGRSLERRSFNDATNTPLNWLFCLDSSGNTLGSKNSTLRLKMAKPKSIVINEIMFETSADESEYIELINVSGKAVDVGGWTIKTGNNKNFVLSYKFKKIEPSDYFVFAADSGIFGKFNLEKNEGRIAICNSSNFSLSNQDGVIVLCDAFANTVDSVHYFSSWGNRNILNTKNKSLEKLNPTFESNIGANWSTCVSALGGTPLARNSIFTPKSQTESGIKISPNPFSPDEDGFEDFTVISYKLKTPVAQILLRIFDDHGRLVRTLAVNKAAASEGQIVFDGKADDGSTLGMGMYIVLLEAVGVQDKTLETLKDVVVIAHKLN